MRQFVVILLAGLGLAAPAVSALPLPTAAAQADAAPCGVVDGFDFPITGIETEITDFGIYRARFGGLHTGIDIAFEHLGVPVRAAARGRVTYSDPEGWDTEKGVVVIQHTFPDGTLVNTLYGHMEELNGHTFPAMNQCVERGDIVGAVGWPSLGRPHLHYEVRTRYRYEGGPGYTQVSPLLLGWLHPLDFTYLARLWILPAHVSHFTLTETSTLPALRLPGGEYVIAHSTHLEGLDSRGQTLWRFDTLGSVTSMLVLPDRRVLVVTSADQVLVLNNGLYSALWPLPDRFISPPVLLGSAVVFQAGDFSLRAYSPEGVPLWATAPLPGRTVRWAISGDRLAVATAGDLWIMNSAGSLLAQHADLEQPLPFALSGGEFLLLAGSALARIDGTLDIRPLYDTGMAVTANALLLWDGAHGRAYLYPGEGRALYAFGPDGALLWVAYMPGSHLRPPRLGVGGGDVIYALSLDGQLLAYRAADGRLAAQVALYSGGVDGVPSARWLEVGADDSVTFSSGFLSVVTLRGLVLAGLSAAAPTS